MDQLHVSKSILMKILIDRDVTPGGPVCQRKCIVVYGETRETNFKPPAARKLYHIFYFNEKFVKIRSSPLPLVFVRRQ